MARAGNVNERAGARARAPDVPTLVEAKLAAPRLRAEIVQRPRILQTLDAGDGAALTVVAAPPGYGKTTAVRDWCARREWPLAWVTLDTGDNDPVRLWRYAATAVNRVRDGLGRTALQRLSLAAPPTEGSVDELMNGVAAFGKQLVLVLDELQTVTDTECLASIDYALEHLPPSLRLITITRTDPALGLAQLRARGGLAELRTEELAFTTAEAHELLVERGRLDLDAHDVELLRARTEGWPAALFLALLWLRTVDDPGRAVREFGGDHRFVADYLSQVVLGALPEDLRSFLMRASVLGRFTAKLCDGVFGRSDSAAVLDELERSNLFIVRLERGGWLRVHSLFAEFARYHLASQEPGAAAEIHHRAAEWLRWRGLPVEAAEHATAVGDHEFIAELLVEHHLSMIRQGDARTLLRWLETLPDDTLLDHPELAAAAATAATMIGQGSIARRRFLKLVDRAHTERPERPSAYGEAVAEMVRAASVDGDVGLAVEAGRRAVELAQCSADDVLVAALAGYARALYLAGEPDEAWTTALQAVEHPDAEHRLPGHALARSTLALVAADRGRLASARMHAERAKAIVGRNGTSRSWLGANAAGALGVVLAGEGSLAEAEHELAYAEHFFRDEVATVQHAWLLVLLARVRCRRGRLAEAATTLRSADEAIAEFADGGCVAALAAEVARELVQAEARAGNGEILESPSVAELTVLRMLATNLSAREIGAELFLSPNTIRSHTRAIYHKLGVSSRSDAVARADALGLLGQTESPM